MLRVYNFNRNAYVKLVPHNVTLPNQYKVEVERIWNEEKTRRGKALFNGEILSAIEVSACGIRGCYAEYKHLVAQRQNPYLYEVLGVRPVAVSGVLECFDGIVFGRRSTTTLQDAGLWELVPSGGLDVSKIEENGNLDYLLQMLIELQEEIGISSENVLRTDPFCLVEDCDSHVLDIGIHITSNLSSDKVMLYHQAATNEYDELKVISSVDLKRFIDDQSMALVGVSRVLIDRWIR